MGAHTPATHRREIIGDSAQHYVDLADNCGLFVGYGAAGSKRARFLLRRLSEWDEQQARIDELVGVLFPMIEGAEAFYKIAGEIKSHPSAALREIAELRLNIFKAKAALTRAKGE